MNKEFADRNNLKIFLKEEKSHLLCLWQLADENDLLAHILAKLSDLVRVDSDDTPATIEPSSKDKHNKIEETFKMDISSDFLKLSCSVTLKENLKVIKNMRLLEADSRKSTDEEEKSDLRADVPENE